MGGAWLALRDNISGWKRVGGSSISVPSTSTLQVTPGLKLQTGWYDDDNQRRDIGG
jgi:hypothetical protein